MNITFERYSPSSANESTTTGVITCYRSAFANPPWNEWLRCSACGASWGIKEEFPSEHCGQVLVDYWPQGIVRQDLYREITPETSCWIAKEDDTVVGFCWGYHIKKRELEQKLGLSLPPLANIAYQDDLGVLESHQGCKIAKELFKRRLADFLAQGLETGVVRTRRAPVPSVTYLWFTKQLGYRELARYPESDGRVILSNSLVDVRARLLLGAPG